MVPLSFAGEELLLTEGRAVYWPREGTLLVADLHLEKGSFFAQHGQPIPPYDSRETLERVALAIRETGARRVITLGDNFHDPHGASRMEPHACGMLAALTKAVDWVWITGNHDIGPESRRRDGAGDGDGDGDAASPAAQARCGGTLVDELELSGLILRHRAKKGETRPELSGHFHPRLQLKVRHRRLVRPCTVISANDTGPGAPSGRMILPAFGAFTAGMDAADPAILSALQPASTITAVVPAQGRLATFPLWRRAA